ncbi:MAG TPA: glycosyltransferase [Terriglobia bacterium]|nr:glycosyltransferase [Terriglobia bacterium]
MQLAVVIPVYQPGVELWELLQSLIPSPLESIIVVDDGSEPEYGKYFERARSLPRVHVLRHERNFGKGAALKTGIDFVLSRFPQLLGIVTADADGQHRAEDILAVAQRFTADPGSIVLGTRQFEQRVPWKSRLGNRITRRLVRWLLGRDLSDTQTGLRAIPLQFLPTLLKIRSDGYEFELDMLIASKHQRIPLLEQPIKTIYQEGNPTSHFNPLLDSAKIIFVLLRFTSLSLLTAILDNSVFIVALSATGSILSAQMIGRAAACSFNYPLARKAVFLADRSHRKHLPRYLSLVLFSGTVSYLLLNLLSYWAVHNVVVAKIAAETLLFLFNFAVQRDLVFVSQPRSDK